MALVEARYRYRLRVSPAQAHALQGVFDTCRFVWNQALGRWGDLWRHEGLSLSYRHADKELTGWRGRLEWLAAQPCVPQQQVLRDLYRSISAFFDRANPSRRPCFKARKTGYATARWTTRGFSVSGSGLGFSAEDRLAVAVAGGRVGLRVVWSRPLPSAPTSVSVYRDPAGHHWASLVVRVEVPDRPLVPTGRATGLDVGLSTFATTEDPAGDVANPRYARGAAKALARSQRNTARKAKGSRGRARARRRAARVAARVASQRADCHHKAARVLVAAYDRIGVEDLRVKSMPAKGKGRHKGRAEPLDRRRRVGPAPSCPGLAGSQGGQDHRGAPSCRHHPALQHLRDESQAPHRAVGPGIPVPGMRDGPVQGSQRRSEPEPGPLRGIGGRV